MTPIEQEKDVCALVVFEESVELEKTFDSFLKDIYPSFAESVNNTRLALNKADSIACLHGDKSEKTIQNATAINLLFKALNDIILGYQLLRLGRYDWAYGMKRPVIEAICTAILVQKDMDKFRKFQAQEMSVQKNIRVLNKRAQDLGLNPQYFNHVIEMIDKCSDIIHPTVLALSVGYGYSPKASGWHIGGHFDATKERHYIELAQDLIKLAKNIAESAENLFQRII